MTKHHRGRPPRSTPQPTKVSPEQREALIGKLREGYDLHHAMLEIDLTDEPDWDSDIQAAYEAGLARLRGKRLKLALQGHSGPSLSVIDDEVKTRERTLAEKRVATPADGGAMSEWVALFDQLGGDEQFLAHSLLVGDIGQFQTSLRCLVVARASELIRDPDWLSGINGRWADAIRSVSSKPEPRRVEDIEILDPSEAIPPTRAVVPFRSTPFNPPPGHSVSRRS